MRQARVDIVFTDTKGRRWLVYDWALVAGIRYRRRPGEAHADFRGFLLRGTGEKRVYTFTGDKELRALSPDLLLEQLRASKPWRSAERSPATKATASSKPAHAERLEPPRL